MARTGLVIRCGLVALTICGLSGCYQRMPLDVTVVDAQTGAPVAGAKLQVHQAGKVEFFAPTPAEGKTDANGHAVLRVVVDRLIRLSADAEGYKWASSSWRRDWQHATGSAAAEWGDQQVTLRMTREPTPDIYCLLPQGYTGRFEIEFGVVGAEMPRTDHTHIVRLRRFEHGGFAVGAAYRRRPGSRVFVEYPNGTVLSPADWQAASTSLGRVYVWPEPAFEWVRRHNGEPPSLSAEGCSVFVVASLAEIESLRLSGTGAR